MKGDYAGAAKKLAQDASIMVAAVDSTVEQKLTSMFGIKGFPTLKYFYKGEEYEEYNGGRRKMDFVEYLKKKMVASQKDELWSVEKNLTQINYFIMSQDLKNKLLNLFYQTSENPQAVSLDYMRKKWDLMTKLPKDIKVMTLSQAASIVKVLT